MGIPPAGSLADVYLKTAHAAKRPLPIFPLPRHLIQEKTVSVDIFHTLSGIFLADWDCMGRDPSVTFSHGSFSCCQLPQQRPDGPLRGLLRGLTRQPQQLITVWPAILTANNAELSEYFQWRRPHVAQEKERKTISCFGDGCLFFFSLTFNRIHFKDLSTDLS